MANRYMNSIENNKFYRPATFESISFNEPKKAMLISEYFARQGIKVRSTSIPTVNLTFGIISHNSVHISKPGYDSYQCENRTIASACASGNPATVYKKSNYKAINGCRFAYAADLPIAYLVEIMSKNKDNKSIHELYDEHYQNEVDSVIDRIQLANIKDMNRSLNKQNEALKAQNEVLKTRIGELKTSIGKLFDIAYK